MAQVKATGFKRVTHQGSCCCVPYCSNRINGHTFPKSELMRELWLDAIRRENFTPKARTVVCYYHFRPEDYISRTYHGKYNHFLPDNIAMTVPTCNFCAKYCCGWCLRRIHVMQMSCTNSKKCCMFESNATALLASIQASPQRCV